MSIARATVILLFASCATTPREVPPGEPRDSGARSVGVEFRDGGREVAIEGATSQRDASVQPATEISPGGCSYTRIDGDGTVTRVRGRADAGCPIFDGLSGGQGIAR